MIVYIKGRILLREPGRLFISTGNLGYAVTIDQKTECRAKALGEEQELYTCQIVRENEISLYGFDSLIKLETFELLLMASKVGPKIALNFLSFLPAETILQTIANQEIKNFGKITGVGPKLMSQVLLDCKKRALRLIEKYGLVMEASTTSTPNDEFEFTGNEKEVSQALNRLGFTGSEIRQSLSSVRKQKGQFSTEETISLCLRFFYQSRE